ncbi:restriction endonuclease subunit S [Streptomyces sp. SCSIO ZS0520]|uniref:restriction endonuclease subunit S n=1 Tax=Streptomyces sp. SCSIO ZS0520 TaxID=2892996 RepID=UPI0021D8AF04|nr:restriction endonuclease subunit S [Streptomyces sp. SCSIO ZS0520]
MTEWTMIRLRDACNSVDYGLTASASSKETGTRFLRITDIVGDSFSWNDVPFVAVSEGQVERYRVSPGDIVIARTGATTGVSRWLDTVPSDAVFASYLVRLKISDRYDSRFIGYALKGGQFWDYVRGVLGDKSAQPNASATTLVAAPLSVPSDIAEQRRIAGVLGALDDKIAANERIAVTALDLAESRYRAAADSDSWRAVTLGSAARWLSGGTPKTSESSYWGGGIPWISALSLKSPWIDDSDRKLTDLGSVSGTRMVPAETIIFVVRGSSLKSEFRVGITQCEVAFGQDCKALIPDASIDPNLLFHAVRSNTSKIMEMVDETSIGAGRLSTDLISKLEVRVPEMRDDPTAAELRMLNELAAGRQRESRALALLRDALLPQLMSGKLRVRDAEKIVEDAV